MRINALIATRFSEAKQSISEVKQILSHSIATKFLDTRLFVFNGFKSPNPSYMWETRASIASDAELVEIKRYWTARSVDALALLILGAIALMAVTSPFVGKPMSSMAAKVVTTCTVVALMLIYLPCFGIGATAERQKERWTENNWDPDPDLSLLEATIRE